MNNQIIAQKQQILENIQSLEKLCADYWQLVKDHEDIQVFELGDQDIYDAAFQSVFETFYESKRIV